MKKTVPVWLSVVLLILCVASVVHSVYATIVNFSSNLPFVLMCISSALLALAAMAYCIGGYKKNKAFLFKLVCLFMAVTAVMGLVQTIVDKAGALLIVIYALLALIGLIFLVVPNLGKKRSYILAIANLGLMVVLLVALGATGALLEPVESIIFSLDKMVIFGIIVYAKYVDKDARGAV